MNNEPRPALSLASLPGLHLLHVVMVMMMVVADVVAMMMVVTMMLRHRGRVRTRRTDHRDRESQCDCKPES
ncbi:hypothetical protein [Mesorhizobium sp. LjRoot246]|uniref:hypothetical protein n=1 Tax=Mesorhizobium sp. LjRoot246 TaxID=3342294 RepID=UPI003ECF4794